MTDWILPQPFVDGKVARATTFQAALNSDLERSMHKLAYKTTDQSVVNNNATLTDITELSASFRANEMWYLEVHFRYGSSAGGTIPGIQLSINTTTVNAARVYLRCMYIDTGGTYQDGNIAGDPSDWQTNGFPQYILSSGGYYEILKFRGLMFCNLAFTLKTGFMQNSSSATSCTVKAGSYMQGMKIGTNPYPDFAALQP